ncbi:MAG: HD domain-containing protein [Bacteroidales bacterium]|nr:HD domain-containing protein [Bacteroidales bacterium]MDY6444722.1 HD domain-containing protein [Bacteroidales bacterium]
MSTITAQFLDRPIFRIVSEVAAERGVRAFVIGGFVRDCFLGRPRADIDIVVEGSGIDFAKAVGQKTKQHVSYFKNFGTAMLHFRGDEVEFVGARKESYRRESRKPIVENGTLEDDQQRRDFTINAMAFSLQPEDFGALVDPFGGIRDLNDGIIRTPLDPDTTYSDDPLRMLRAVRFATKLSTPEHPFRIVPESMESMRRMADRLSILSCERIAEELNKMLAADDPAMAFRLMDEAGLLGHVLPELLALKGVETVDGRGHKDNFAHSLAVLDNVARASDKLYLRWAALLHDIGKPASKRYDASVGWTFHGHEVVGARMVPKIFDRLRLPLDEMKYVQKLVRLHLRPIALVDDEVTDSAVRRLLFDAGDDIDDLMILCNADITSKNEAKVARIRANFELVARKLVEVEAKDAIRNFKNPIDGEYVMQVYGVPPCKQIGQIKEMVKEAILDGIIGNNFEEADAFMRQHASELGLHEV